MVIIIEYSEALQYYDIYQSGFSTCKLGKIFKHDPSYFISNFKKYGLKLRDNKTNSRKYTADFSYFKNIDTQEKAYWLGYIFADGYVTCGKQNRKQFGISLSTKDKPQIEKLKRCLNSTYPIHDYVQSSGYAVGSSYSRLLIDSEEMFDDLVSHGVLEHKTNIVKPPNINEEYFSSFILGYFDGDGSICVNNSTSPFYSISFVGTDDLLRFIHEYLYSRGAVDKDLHIEKRRDGQTVSYIRYGGNIIVPKIMDILYENIDSSLPLERKRQLYLNCKNRIF